MAQTITGIGSTKVINALDTYNHTVLSNNMYAVSLRMDVTPASSISIVIKQNTTTIFTSAAPAANQSWVLAKAVLNCVTNDVISIIVTSSAPVDSRPQRIKGILNIHVGSV